MASKAAEVTATQQKPMAWSRGSVNPITQRSSGSPVQNGVRSPPQTTSENGSSSPSAPLNFLFESFRGLSAELITKQNERYAGIFSSALEKGFNLKMTKKLSSANKRVNGVTDEYTGSGSDHEMFFAADEVVDLQVQGVRFDKIQSRAQNGTTSGFRTDTDISSGWRARERNLQKWESADSAGTDLSLGDGNIGAWDQFETHKNMTGLTSTYNEEDYTTKLNKQDPEYERKLRVAAEKEREILGSAANSTHVAEERGQKFVNDSGETEEDKYSGVRRGYSSLLAGQPNKYTPPAMRAPTGKATTRGAPVDPAIIDSAFADEKKPQPVKSEPVKREERPTAPAEQAKPIELKASASASPTTTSSKGTAGTPQVPPVKASPSSSRVSAKEGGATATVERDVHEAFKEFKQSEKLRIQEAQRSVARRDKAVKLNDLKKFSENFKLNTAIPQDLLPILARDEKKQLELQEKAKTNVKETSSTPPRSTPSSAAVTPATAKPAPRITPARDVPSQASPQNGPDRSQQRERQAPNANAKNLPQYNRNVPSVTHRLPHGNLVQRLNAQQSKMMSHMQQHPMPIDPRMAHQGFAGVTSPGGGFRPNPNATGFTPTSKPFVPGSNARNGSSPVRVPSSQRQEPPRAPEPTPGNLFGDRSDGRRSVLAKSEMKGLHAYYNPIETMRKDVQALPVEEQKRFESNGGIPKPFVQGPTWESTVPKDNEEKGVKDMFSSTTRPTTSANPVMMGQPSIQFQHQLPYGAMPPQSMPQALNPAHQTPRHVPVQPHHSGPGTPHQYDESRMTFSQGTPGVNPSPRPQTQYMYPVQPIPGQPFQQPLVYGTSPNGGHPMVMQRQMSNNPQFQAQYMMPQGPPGQYMASTLGAVVPGQNGQQAFQMGHPVQQHQGMAGMNGMTGYPSPMRQTAVMMAHSVSQSGHGGPQVVAAYPFNGGGPMPQLRYPQAPSQYSTPNQNFAQQHHPGNMRGMPNANYAQPMQPVMPQSIHGAIPAHMTAGPAPNPAAPMQTSPAPSQPQQGEDAK